MAKFILLLLLSSCLSACGGGGGGSEDVAPASAQASTAVTGCVPRAVTVALLGDSTQFGYDSKTGRRAVHNPGERLQANLEAQFGKGAVTVTDYGVSGTRADQAPRVAADVVVANFGINEMLQGVSVDQYAANMAALGATLIETANPLAGKPAEGVDQGAYVAAAIGLGLPVADVHSYVTSQVLGWSDDEADGVHPDDELYILIVDHVLTPAVNVQLAQLRCVKF